MPRFRRRFSRRRFGRRRMRRGGLSSLIRRAIGRVVKPEFKFIDTGLNGTLDTGAPVVINLNACAQGNGISDRLGDSITVRSLGFRFFVQHPTAANPPLSQAVRILIVQDTGLTVAGTLPTNGGGVGSITTSGNPAAYKDIASNTGNRFKVWYDRYAFLKQIAIGAVAGSTAVNGFAVTKYIRFRKPITIHFTGAGGATWAKNSLFIMAYSNLTAAGGASGINGITRLRFTDS